MSYLQGIGQIVSVGALSLFSPLPSGLTQARLLSEPLVGWARPASAPPRVVHVATAFVHADSVPPMGTEDSVTAAPDSRSARYARLASLWNRIEEFARMSEGWAGEDTVPPSREIAAHVGRLISWLPEDLELPQATASAEGEIGLTWFKDSDRLDTIVSPDGHLTWASKVGDKFFDGDVLELSSASFDPLYEALAEFYG